MAGGLGRRNVVGRSHRREWIASILWAEVERLRESKDDALRLAISKLGPWYHDVELTPEVSTNPANKQYMASRWRFLKPFIPDDLTGSLCWTLVAMPDSFLSK